MARSSGTDGVGLLSEEAQSAWRHKFFSVSYGYLALCICVCMSIPNSYIYIIVRMFY